MRRFRRFERVGAVQRADPWKTLCSHCVNDCRESIFALPVRDDRVMGVWGNIKGTAKGVGKAAATLNPASTAAHLAENVVGDVARQADDVVHGDASFKGALAAATPIDDILQTAGDNARDSGAAKLYDKAYDAIGIDKELDGPVDEIARFVAPDPEALKQGGVAAGADIAATAVSFIPGVGTAAGAAGKGALKAGTKVASKQAAKEAAEHGVLQQVASKAPKLSKIGKGAGAGSVAATGIGAHTGASHADDAAKPAMDSLETAAEKARSAVETLVPDGVGNAMKSVGELFYKDGHMTGVGMIGAGAGALAAGKQLWDHLRPEQGQLDPVPVMTSAGMQYMAPEQAPADHDIAFVPFV